MRTAAIGAVLFDCDGVLADSEGVANGIVAEELTALGWPMTPHEAQHEFLGLALPDMEPKIEARIGRLPAGWSRALGRRIEAALSTGLRPIPGAGAALEAVRAAGLPMALCSNSSRGELAVKMRVLGFAHYFEGRIFSFEDVELPKPAPDLYLAAARACGVRPEDCLVVEDSAPGAAAGMAAGCRVLGIVPGLGVPHIEGMPRFAAHLAGLDG
ncbi:HAD family phosphatase [Roseococcus sp. SYP-B2431]|uniref:HAD family hydrolase n=1 Tax=Roseococcus sp. SYP-B2431 TaxID=2496640 RepID=UPI0013F4129F|nr:HAD-IA family hydrolase [Roseococcus sp. SYP-B2431]